MERLGTTANRMSGLAVESAYLCGLFANAVRGDHRMLADGMHPVVLMTDQQHSRALRHAATIMPQAFPNGQPPSTASAPATASRQPSADTIPRISINPGVCESGQLHCPAALHAVHALCLQQPCTDVLRQLLQCCPAVISSSPGNAGFAPMLVGSPSLRRIMPTRAGTARASAATSTGGAGSPGASPAGDDSGATAALSLLQGMLGPNADISQAMVRLHSQPAMACQYLSRVSA